ncbi:MAG: 1-acyl-sn-glycerol-3-phosphate acyltransferase [Myxococcaceae bacterium]|nr:1-acyl-sn-glycerol-3-phosphate acyltransferase [Myxococcaceae bacterium]
MTPVPPKPALPKPLLPKAVQPKREAPKPPPPPKIVVPKPKTGDGTPARRAVTSFASFAADPPPPQPKVTVPERPSGRPSAQTLQPVPSPPVFEPVPHAASPEARHAPQPHDGSPELKAEFTAHDTSPVVVELLEPGRATPHAGSPAVVRELNDHEAVPHEGSPEVVGGRVTELSVAFEAAREVGEGLARPLLAAATGMARAAKAALGFGSNGPVDTWGKDAALSSSLQPLGDFLYDTYFRVTVEGADQVPQGPCIIVANHSGALPLDGPMLHYALQRERRDLESARWLVEDQVFHAPVLGVLINRIGAVRAHPENAVRLLEENRPVIVFPEGFLGISKPFTQKYQLKRFGRGGYVKLALKMRVPIVPVAIVGAEESMPLLAKIPAGPLGLPYLPLMPPPLPARWRIRFSEAVTLSGSPEDLAYVQEQNDLVRDTIAGMLASLLAR